MAEGNYLEMFPIFHAVSKTKAERYNQESSGFRKLACLPTMMLALVMASRIRRHYVHALWFRIGMLERIVKVHGAV